MTGIFPTVIIGHEIRYIDDFFDKSEDGFDVYLTRQSSSDQTPSLVLSKSS